MRPSTIAERARARALAIALGWMAAVQAACLLLWALAVLSREAALVHWLLVGVLAPALALWTAEEAAPDGRGRHASREAPSGVFNPGGADATRISRHHGQVIPGA